MNSDNHTFDGGAQRSDLKLRYDLITSEFQRRLARTMTLGEAKYGANNWQKGDKQFAVDAFNHLIEHANWYKDGDTNEDHLAHILANVMFLMYFQSDEDAGTMEFNEQRELDQVRQLNFEKQNQKPQVSGAQTSASAVS